MKSLANVPAIILAGGKGMRIKEVAGDIPKPLLTVGDYSLLEHTLISLRNAGVKKFIISVGFRGDLIKDYFRDGKKYGVSIYYKQETHPLGDAGAFKFSYPRKSETVLLTNADEIRVGLDLEKMLVFHEEKEGLTTMAVIDQSDIENHGVVEFDIENRIKKFLMNPNRDETNSRSVNAGLYFMEKNVLKYFPRGHCRMKDVLKELIKTKRMYAFPFKGVYFNVGTPNILRKANQYFKGLK